MIPSGSTVSQLLIYFGALSIVALVFFSWAILSRRRRGLRPSRHHRSRSGSRRTHRRLEVPSQPRTLAESGGLPPIRNEQQPPSSV